MFFFLKEGISSQNGKWPDGQFHWKSCNLKNHKTTSQSNFPSWCLKLFFGAYKISVNLSITHTHIQEAHWHELQVGVFVRHKDSVIYECCSCPNWSSEIQGASWSADLKHSSSNSCLSLCAVSLIMTYFQKSSISGGYELIFIMRLHPVAYYSTPPTWSLPGGKVTGQTSMWTAQDPTSAQLFVVHIAACAVR